LAQRIQSYLQYKANLGLDRPYLERALGKDFAAKLSGGG
jgi:hypothetical protein